MPGDGGVLRGVEATICAYPWPCAEALAVAWCESRHDPSAVSADGRNWGLMQINLVHLGRVGGNVYALLDAETNVAVAWQIYVDSSYSWRAWSCKP